MKKWKYMFFGYVNIYYWEGGRVKKRKGNLFLKFNLVLDLFFIFCVIGKIVRKYLFFIFVFVY